MHGFFVFSAVFGVVGVAWGALMIGYLYWRWEASSVATRAALAVVAAACLLSSVKLLVTLYEASTSVSW